MCETMQSSHRLRPAMALVRALLAPTASGDGAGERFCAPLPPSPHFSGACQIRLDEFLFFFSKNSYIFTLGDPQEEGTRKSRWSRVGTSKIIS
jgi:hypothetical protein